MKYLSVCSGIEAATAAWHHMDWKPVAFSEIEPFPAAVLAHHYPTTPNLGDMTKYQEWKFDEPIDLLVGGTPCQSFSVAGLRKGLDDPRGNLMLTYLAIVGRFRPKWVVWENVPGVLSSGGGRDFGSFLGGLAHLGYGFAYRVLDAQWFGVAQRRRRVFVVGCLGDATSAAKVLFESESVCRDSKPSRQTGQEIAGTVTTRTSGGTDEWCEGFIQPFEIANCLTQRMHKGINTTVDEGQPPVLAFEPGVMSRDGGAGHGARSGDSKDEYIVPFQQVSDCLTAAYGTKWNGNASATNGSLFFRDIVGALDTECGGQKLTNQSVVNGHFIPCTNIGVRRLTPTECERLQGFPDQYTQIPWRKKPADQCPDGPRYKALGNSMAVPCTRWIGERIQKAHP